MAQQCQPALHLSKPSTSATQTPLAKLQLSRAVKMGSVIIAALVTWLLAAVMGGYLLATWLANGGLRTRSGERPSRFAPQLILGHGGLAATGLVVWIIYLVVTSPVLAWIALSDLVLVATLGATMFGLWIRAGHGRSKGRHAAGPRHAAEDHFPPPAVLGHGLFAVGTVVLVLVTTLRGAR